MLIHPSSINPPKTADDDLRIGHFIQSPSPKKNIHLLGFCSDHGVFTNGGRIGAANAPDAIRTALFKLTPDPVDPMPLRMFFEAVLDHGNMEANTIDLHVAQESLGDWTAERLGKNELPLILGGGHETSFGHFLGYVKSNRPVTILNWDAHADVRPLKNGKPHSGSPFYQALEHDSGVCKNYIVGGLHRHSLSATHLEFLQEKKAGYYFKGELTPRLIEHIYDSLDGPTMVTMDMDALDQSIAPGVSAPAVNGFSLDTWFHLAYFAGKCKWVQSFDIVELNPKFDIDNQTARVAALTIWHFAKGFGERENG